MARPRSVPGLLGYLAWLHVRRRPILALGLVAAGALLARGFAEDAAPSLRGEIQAAVLKDGFAILEGDARDRHVLGYDDDGQLRFRHAVPLLAPDVRVVGSSVGPAVGWLDRKKLQVAAVTGDGELGKASSWGQAVRFQCDGRATNEHRFALAWADKDKQVWFVHGPVSKRNDLEEPTLTRFEANQVSWCGVASAHEDVVLLWREGTRSFASFCSKKSCELIIRLPLEGRHTLLGFGCTKDNCVLAARDGDVIKLGWVHRSGKLVWSKPLTDAVPGTTFSIVGAGNRAIAVAYVTNEGATAFRVIASGSMVRAWHEPGATETPSLAWARDRLLVAHRHGDAIAPEVVQLPR